MGNKRSKHEGVTAITAKQTPSQHPVTQSLTKASTQTEIKPINWEINGYIREMCQTLHLRVIPPEINKIVALFYNPVCFP